MKMTLSNNRTCIITKVKLPKEQLVKVTRAKDVWHVDFDQVIDGRSFYLVLNLKNLNKLKKQRRRFKMTEENFEEVIQTLESSINE